MRFIVLDPHTYFSVNNLPRMNRWHPYVDKVDLVLGTWYLVEKPPKDSVEFKLEVRIRVD